MTKLLPEGADDIGGLVPPADHDPAHYTAAGRLRSTVYEAEMARLQEQLVMLQYWIASQGLKVAVVFEGRGSAGKGGVIKRITERTSPRTVRVVALPVPTEREKTQWYFQRYVENLPAAGEMVLFDRSWYNRSNVEWVMGYCTEAEHQEFLRSCPEFERMLVRSGIVVLKYWFSVSFEEQRRRFEARNAEPLKRWKLSDMDLAEHELYVRYSMAKDTTFQYTDIKQAPWYVVASDDKRASRLNCISHLLSQFDYEDMAPDVVELPDMRQIPYVRPPFHEQTFVPRALSPAGSSCRRGTIPLVGTRRGQPERDRPREPRQSLAGLVAVALGEPRPVGLEGQQAAVPLVRLGLDAGELRLDLGEVVDQVVRDPRTAL